MNTIEQMIHDLCPNGVKRVRLDAIIEIYTGVQFNKSDMQETGSYPVINGGINPSGYIEQFNEEANTITISQGGASAGYVNYLTTKFWAGAHCFVVKPNEQQINKRFLYHYLKNSEYSLQHTQQGAGIPSVNRDTIRDISIPLPPLPIQEEIVKILDRFAVLTAELEAELEARRKQYEYYRTRLLSFDSSSDSVRWMPLGEVCLDLYSGATPSTGIKEYWENGTIPWMSSGEVNFGQIYEVEKRITQLGYDKCSTKMVPKESVVIALAGQGKTRGMVALTHVDLCTNQSLCALIPNKKLVIPQYLFQYLKTQYRKLREVSSGDGTRGGLNLTILRSYQIQVPPLSEQERIVNILDKFDQLVNGVKDSIPALIDDVQKQYEFYRNKLLTFPE